MTVIEVLDVLACVYPNPKSELNYKDNFSLLIAVDTHVSRVSKRLAWAAKNDSVLQVEEKLMKKIPKERWGEAHHQILLFGRYHSTARDKRDVYEILDELKEIHCK